MHNNFIKYRKNYFSQNGEDGIIEEILKRLNINTGWVCEFGAWDGKLLSNTYSLFERGWGGIEIEADKEKFKNLIKNIGFYNNVVIMNEFVRGDNIDSLLSRTHIPQDFDLLSIDVDGNYYNIWKGLQTYNPKIVVIEIKSDIMPGIEYMNENGTSFSSMLELGKKKGYTIVCHTGNIIFVRTDLVAKLNLSRQELENPESLFIIKHLSPLNKIKWLIKRFMANYI